MFILYKHGVEQYHLEPLYSQMLTNIIKENQQG